jgi:predicted nicotinamide N-methyase
VNENLDGEGETRSDEGGRPEPVDFIRRSLHLLPVPSLAQIRVYTAHPSSRLSRLLAADEDGEDPPPPYWAYHWAGGTVLASYILDRPETVAGLRVLDLGAGSGVVGIAAAKAGATVVIAADVDANAVAAIGLNAAANGVRITAIGEDLVAGDPPSVDLVAVGDLFYEEGLAIRVTGFLDRCLAAGIKVLVGDPGRAYLPHGQLRLLAEYPVADFGDASSADRPSSVFSFEHRRDQRE